MKLYYWDSAELQMSKLHYGKLLIIFLILIGWCTLLGVIGYQAGFSNGKKSQLTEKDVVLIYQETENNQFSKRKFYEYLKEINVKFPEIVFAQAYKESGFKSDLFKDQWNPFGMKEASKRPNLQKGANSNGYVYFDTWKDAVLDYTFYQTYIGVGRLKTEDEYLNLLKEIRYWDVDHPNNVNYIPDLKNIAHNIEKYLD